MAFNSLSSIKTVYPWDTDQKWYMLQRNTDRLESRGEAKAGSIFQLDYNETKLRRSGSYGSNIVLENIEHERQKVFWQPDLFFSLDDDLKALLLAVDDPKERLHIYTEQKDLLYYAKGMKEGNLVEIILPGSGREAFGEVKYIGPYKAGDTARYFGIELSEPPRDSRVPKMESDLFKCIQNRGVIVPMNCLKVHTQTVKTTLLELTGKNPLKSRKERTDGIGIGVEEAAKPSVIKEGDVVMAYTKMQSEHGRCSWVMGKVLMIHDGKVAVEVDKSYGSVMQAWNGFHKHTKLMTSPSKDTVLVNLQCIKTLDQHTEVSSLAASEKGRKSFASVLQEGNSNPTPPSQGKTLEQLASNICNTSGEMQENVQKANDLSTDHSVEDFASCQESMWLSHEWLTSDERASSLQDIGNVNYPGEAVRRSSSVTEPKQNSSHTHKQVKHSGGKDYSSGNFMSSIKSAFSGKHGGFTHVSPEEERTIQEISLEKGKQKKLLKEVEDLRNQLEKLKTTYADTVKRLEESQKLMLTLKSKNAELEAELHHTKLNLASQQEEVERLKKELEDGKKLTYLGNEPVKESTEGCSGDASSPVGMRESSRSLEDFGKFQFHLSSYLTRDIIRDLTLVLAFSPTESEEAEDDKIKFIRLLSRKGLISPTDITKLTNALDEIGHHGVLNAVKNLFDRNPPEAFR